MASGACLFILFSFVQQLKIDCKTNNPRVDAYDRYSNATGAVLDSDTGLLRITPEQYADLQSLFFVAGSTTFELTANAQIWPRALNSFINGTADGIYLVIQNTGRPSGQGLDFVNGYTFLERFYSVFDTENRRVGLATTSFTTVTSN
jgi:cathepsin E